MRTAKTTISIKNSKIVGHIDWKVTGHLSDTDICPTRTFVRQPVRNFADICPTRTFVRQSHFKFILKTISHVKGAISGDYR